MQISVLNGVYTDENSDFRTSYPRNMVPVPKSNGISQGYLRPADGITEVATLPGKDRGGILWDGVHYRVAGKYLVSVSESGTVKTLGEINDGSDRVVLDYSFDRLGIASGTRLYYYDKTDITRVTDADLGDVHDLVWLDGYFAVTDGEFIVVTELNDPTQVEALKYGSSEVDPDPIVALREIRNELIAVNRYSMEFFSNVGGTGFPFQRINGAQIPYGAISRDACCVFMETVAFIGGGRNEDLTVMLGAQGSKRRIATQEIDKLLKSYTEAELVRDTLIEAVTREGHEFLYIHLPDKTVVYDAASTAVMGQPVWHTLTSGVDSVGKYRARGITYSNGKFYVGDTEGNRLGYLDNSKGEHWGEKITWEFSTTFLYSEALGAIFHELELVALTGRTNKTAPPVISTSYSIDGQTFSKEKTCSAGAIGQRNHRIKWLGQGHMHDRRIQRFKGSSDDRISVARLEARIEALYV